MTPTLSPARTSTSSVTSKAHHQGQAATEVVVGIELASNIVEDPLREIFVEDPIDDGKQAAALLRFPLVEEFDEFDE
ncbi:MAG: hypothetical protein AB7V42_16130 [Thermoleophilia bacterium]